MIKFFRGISFLEGLSYLVILTIAYIWKFPEYVRPVGMTHGVLFMAYVFLAVTTKYKKDWDKKTLLIVLVASVIPFGTFYVDKKYLSNK